MLVFAPSQNPGFYLQGMLADIDHRRPKRRWQQHHLHVMHMFRLHLQYVPSVSVPNTLYLSVLLLSFSLTSPVLYVQLAPGLF